MATLYYLPQYKTTTLSVAGGIDDSQTENIVLTNVDNVDITKPGIICINWADPLDTDVCEYISYTSIDGSNELQGVTRGAEGISAKSHNNNVTVAWVVSKTHLNNVNNALSIGGTPTSAVTTTKDEDDMSSNSATALATQQSIKTYVDSGTVTMTNKTLGATTLSGVMTASAAINITIANEGNDIPLTVTQNDTTNNPNAITVTNAGTGNGIYIDQNGNGDALNIDNDGTGYSINITQDGVLASGSRALYVYSNVAQTNIGGGFIRFHLDHASSDGSLAKFVNDGTGEGLVIDQNGAKYALYIDYDGGAGSAAIKLDGCTGSSSKNPESQSEDGWIKINVDGTDRYVPCYAAS